MTSIRSHSYFILLFAVCFVFSAPSAAQAGTGVLKGIITDQTGAVIRGATVLVEGNGVSQTATSDVQGRYLVTGLAPGEYTLRISATTFADYEVLGIRIEGSEFSFNAALAPAAVKQEIMVGDSRQPTTDPTTNAGAVVLKDADLNALSDDREELEDDLLALAGPAAGPNGGEIFVNGFSNAKLPPKASIREIRINQNPFSAEYEKLGYGRVEVFTKPGTDKFRGELIFAINDSHFNSRNPFAIAKPPYQRRNPEGTIEGPLGKRASFFLELERRDIGETSIINAMVLDDALNAVPYRQSVSTSVSMSEIEWRLDYQLSRNNTLVTRYAWERMQITNNGLDTFSLPSRASFLDGGERWLQITETAILSPRSVNEVRFQYGSFRRASHFQGTNVTVQVPQAFTAGSPGLGDSVSQWHPWEVADVLSFQRGHHLVKGGVTIRGAVLDDRSVQNYNGAFTFTSLEAYRITEAGIRDGLSPEQIRANGGGASQFSIVTGNPAANVSQVDGGFFVQDDWRVRSDLTLSGGLRYEAQTNITDRLNFAPRVGFAWALGGQGRKEALAVVRGGFGLFYERVREDLTLEAQRQDGLHQRQYLVANPDFYPTVPVAADLASYESEQVVRRLHRGLRAPYMAQTAFSIERQLPKNIMLSLTYTNTRGFRGLRSRNVNAPLPASGIRPLPGGEIYEYESSGIFRQNQLTINSNARINRRLSLSGYYVWGRARSNYDGPGSFPADQYDLRNEYSRAGFDIRHRMYMSGTIAGLYGIMLSPFVTASSGMPFDIVVGQDLNRDSLFNDRPAWATDLGRASVVHTAYGTFDMAPIQGQRIIPRNLGRAPGAVTVNLRVSKTLGIGEKRDRSRPGNDSQVSTGESGEGHGTHAEHAGGGPANRRYSLTLSASARNLLNTVNLAAPVRNLSSPSFGQSVSIARGKQRGSSDTANRTIDFQVRFTF